MPFIIGFDKIWNAIKYDHVNIIGKKINKVEEISEKSIFKFMINTRQDVHKCTNLRLESNLEMGDEVNELN